MMERTKTFTVEEFVQAIEKDGLPQIQNGFFMDDGGVVTDQGKESLGDKPVIVAACAVGMAAINLGVDLQSLRDAISFPDPLTGKSFSSGLIEDWNDNAGLNYVQIAEKIRRWFPELLKHKVSATVETY